MYDNEMKMHWITENITIFIAEVVSPEHET